MFAGQLTSKSRKVGRPRGQLGRLATEQGRSGVATAPSAVARLSPGLRVLASSLVGSRVGLAFTGPRGVYPCGASREQSPAASGFPSGGLLGPGPGRGLLLGFVTRLAGRLRLVAHGGVGSPTGGPLFGGCLVAMFWVGLNPTRKMARDAPHTSAGPEQPAPVVSMVGASLPCDLGQS